MPALATTTSSRPSSATPVVDGGLQRRLVADVGHPGDHPAVELLDLDDGLVEVLARRRRVLADDGVDPRAEVDGDDVGALLREPDRVRAALAARRPGDEDDLALHASGHAVLLCQTERPRSPQYGARRSRLRILPVGRLGQRVDELDRPRLLVRREVRPGGLDDLRPRSRVVPGLSTTNALTASPHSSSGTPITAHSRTAGMAVDGLLDLGRVDVLAAGDDHVLGAVDDEDVASASQVGEVAGPHPAVAQGRRR